MDCLSFVLMLYVVGQDTTVKSVLAVPSVPNGEEVLKIGHRDSIWCYKSIDILLY